MELLGQFMDFKMSCHAIITGFVMGIYNVPALRKNIKNWKKCLTKKDFKTIFNWTISCLSVGFIGDVMIAIIQGILKTYPEGDKNTVWLAYLITIGFIFSLVFLISLPLETIRKDIKSFKKQKEQKKD